MVCGDGYLSPYSTPRRPEYLVVCKLAGVSSLERRDGKIHISHYPLFRLAIFALMTQKGYPPTPHRARIPLQKSTKRRLPPPSCAWLFLCSSVLMLWLYPSYATATGSLLRLRLRFGFASASIASSSASVGSVSSSASTSPLGSAVASASFCCSLALPLTIGITTT